MDLLSILPNFSTKPYAHILPPLERSRINTVDLISLDTLEIAKRAHVPPADVRRLAKHVIKALHHDVGFEEAPRPEEDEPSSSLVLDSPLILGRRTKLDLSRWCAISTLDPTLDALLGGGVPTGYVTEVTGESGSGKTQFLLSLLLAVQLPPPQGAGKSAIYISTEAPLSTTRLSQLIESHPCLVSLPRKNAPSLEKILSINAMDLESQDHILNYQLPVAIRRYNVGLVVIDSITSNYRAEHTSHNLSGLSTRSGELAKLGQMLRNLAVNEDIAIVVANQVSDRFEGEGGPSFPRMTTTGDGAPFSSSPTTQQPREPYPSALDRGRGQDRVSGAVSPLPRTRPSDPNSNNAELNLLLPPPSTPTFPSSSPQPTQDDTQQPFDGSYLVGNPVRNELLSLQHQQRFFTGWGDSPTPAVSSTALKTPALGLVWSTQIACRIALKKYARSADTPENDVSSGPVKIATETETENENKNENPKDDNPSEHHPPPIKPSSPDPALTTTVDTDPNDMLSSSSHHIEKPPTTTILDPQPTSRLLRRTMKLVLAPWTGSSGPFRTQRKFNDDEVEFEIWKGGLRARGTRCG